MTQYIENLKQIIDNYENFIVDLWGVIHDGDELYEYAKSTLKSLNKSGKKILFLSNSPKRSKKSIEFLSKMGINRNLYHDVLTSGEFFYNNRDKINYGYNFYHLGPEYNQDILDETNFKKVNLNDADFILSTGLFDYNKGFTNELEILSKAINKNIPMICINPDLIVITRSSHEYLCAGAVANEYQKLGGKVSFVGKPYLDLYEHAYQIIGGGSKKKILAIGDSLRTDITGAKNFGIESLLIKAGIHSNELEKTDESTLFDRYKIKPNYHTQYFKYI